MKNYAKTRYNELKLMGVCVWCGVADATHGVHCGDCYARAKAYRQDRVKKLKENGLCVGCGKAEATIYNSCKACHDKKAEYQRKYHRTYKRKEVSHERGDTTTK